MLIEHGADIDNKGANGRTPLMMYAGQGTGPSQGPLTVNLVFRYTKYSIVEQFICHTDILIRFQVNVMVPVTAFQRK